jgi:protein SCO1/2
MRWPRRAIAAAALAGALAWTGMAAGQSAPTRLDPAEVVARSEAAVGRVVGPHLLTDSEGRALPLESLRGRPLVVSLIYTSCASVCPVATRRLEDAVEQANRVIGAERFGVLTIGFDARHDTPRRVAEFAAAQGAGAPNWRYASADAATLGPLLDELGFSYAAIAGGFEHVAQTTLLDRDGRVLRQVYGEDFPVQVLLEPLKDAVYGRAVAAFSAQGLLDRIRFLCTAYDPGAGRYRINYGLVFGSAVGALSLIVAFGLLAREWVRSSTSHRHRTP